MDKLKIVNSRSPFARLLAFSFTVLVLASSAVAHADRVVVLPLQADSSLDEDSRDDLEEALAESISSAGHEFVTESNALQVDAEALPSNANELRAVAELQSAQWVLIVSASRAPEGYRLELRSFSVAWDRDETAEVWLRNAERAARLEQVMRALLTREGAEPHRSWMLSGDPSPDELAETQRLAAEAEEARLAEEQARELERQSEEERARAAEAQAQAAAQTAWEERPRYGDGPSMMAGGGLGALALVAVPAEASGGGLMTLQGRFGYAIESVPGLELRAGLDVVLGSASAFSLTGGGVYLFSPFTELPLHFGVGADVGYFQSISGGRAASLIARLSGLGVWTISPSVALELVVPEVAVLSAGGGALALGGGLRVTTRFD